MKRLGSPYRGRVKRLIAFVRRMSDANFDMQHVTLKMYGSSCVQDLLQAGAGNPETSCGAVGCLLGWTPAIFPENFEWNSGGSVLRVYADGQSEVCGMFSFDAVGGEWYGVSPSVFWPSSYEYLRSCAKRLSEREAVLVALRGMLAGKLDPQSNGPAIQEYVAFVLDE